MIHKFKTDISQVSEPELFNYPFYSSPNELGLIAVSELQDFLLINKWEHNFGLSQNDDSLKIGKMFGILVVKDQSGQLYSLWAYSGELQGSNPTEAFVPSVVEKKLNIDEEKKSVDALNHKIQRLDSEIKDQQPLKEKSIAEIASFRSEMIAAKKLRKIKREKQLEAEENLIKESLHMKFLFKELKSEWQQKLRPLEDSINKKADLIKKRKKILSELQTKQFKQYKFLNANNDYKDLSVIFEKIIYSPPPGSGDCAAPKLLHFAYLNKLMPISLCEFWWGESPRGAVRKHKNFYPSCSSRCGPILGHMLQGLNVEENPLLINTGFGKEIEIIFEDDDLYVINKPEGLLSVPGKTIKDSVESRLTNSFIVHRLDQETSGLMIVAKNLKSQTHLQKQFVNKTIKKTYLALLDGVIQKDSGEISLPLTLDFNNRPRQKVCAHSGKPSTTLYKVLKRSSDKTLIHFFPKTGRTHQLRMHSAHIDGLGCPIIGDTLYGIRDERLFLHAESIEFTHPKTSESLRFISKVDFSERI